MASAHAWMAEFDEAEIVAGLLMQFRDHLDGHRPSDNAMLAGVERLMENVETEYLLAAPDEDSAPAGVAQLRYRFSVWTASPDCWLEDLFVREDARGQGVGAALVALTLERGCRRVELDTREDNTNARALYERFGFRYDKTGGEGRDLFLGRRLDEQ